MNRLIAQLQEYIKLGLSPIPLKGKAPLVRWKEYQFNLQDFTRPGVNIGIKGGSLASGDYLYFVDLDNKTLIAEFYEHNPLLIGVPLVSTPRGFHVWLSWKEPVKTRVFSGGEIRGEGSYVVAPPSVSENGKPYRWIVPLKGQLPLYHPQWLGIPTASLPIVLNPSNEVDEQLGRDNMPASVPQGYRHNTLVSYLGAMHKAHFTEEEALVRAIAWNLKNKPPMTQSEVVYTIKTCWSIWDVFKD